MRSTILILTFANLWIIMKIHVDKLSQAIDTRLHALACTLQAIAHS